jgi:hypothetical protein
VAGTARIKRRSYNIVVSPAFVRYDAPGDERPQPVAGAERPGRTSSAGTAGESRELAVGDHLALRQRAEHALAVAVEAVVELERDAGEIGGPAGEIRLQALDHRVVPDRARCRPGAR